MLTVKHLRLLAMFLYTYVKLRLSQVSNLYC